MQGWGPSFGYLYFNSDGSFDYFPYGGFTGNDVFWYVAKNTTTGAQSAPVFVELHVANINPEANADSYSIAAGAGPLVVSAPGALANDSWADEAIYVTGTGPAQGSLNIQGDGSFVYSPNAGFVGNDSFQYYVKNFTTGEVSAPTVVYLQVYLAAPVAEPDAYTAYSNYTLNIAAPGVLANDSAANTTQFVSGPANGTLALHVNGSFDYTPAALFVGTDSFQYRAVQTATGLVSNVVTVTLTVLASDPPVANPDLYTVASGFVFESGVPGVLENDQYADGAQISSGPTNGTLTLYANGSFRYTPVSGFTGGDSFYYVAVNTYSGQQSAPASVTLNVVY